MCRAVVLTRSLTTEQSPVELAVSGHRDENYNDDNNNKSRRSSDNYPSELERGLIWTATDRLWVVESARDGHRQNSEGRRTHTHVSTGTDGRTDGQTDRSTDRPTDRQTDLSPVADKVLVQVIGFHRQ